MDKVVYQKDFKKLKETSQQILADFYPSGSEVLIKIHFGEPGNKTALMPKDVKPLVEAMKQLRLEPVFIDTPVKYDSPRNNVEGYGGVVRERGFDKLGRFIISDNMVEVKTKDFKAEVCKELAEAENVLVFSHIKGHPCSGFGGAVKNLGMGGVSRKTKALEHDLGQPVFVKECQGCGTCAELCPFKAITMESNKAVIDLQHCAGCSICQEVCPHHCLAPKKAGFDDLLAQGAAAVINSLPKKTLYINYLKNITRGCDCFVDAGPIIAEDMGILFSDNPAAVDKASLDLINEKAGKNVFREAHHKEPSAHLEFAGKYINRELTYNLEEK